MLMVSAHSSNHSKQRGVVLISALIFLLLILLLLRFTLTGSELQERKAGIDQELSMAVEGAEVALRSAEGFILSQQTPGFTPPPCPTGASQAACEADQADAVAADNLAYWQSTAAIDLGFVVEGDPGPCLSPDPSSPAWTCANWGNQFRAGGNTFTANKLADSVYVTELKQTLAEGAAVISPRYIIERFAPDELDLNVADPRTKKSVVLRVTAVGFGVDDGSGDNVTNHMAQATYILTP
ncbi:pilus assembly protein [Suttonella sp. R2A3]|uniref:pilus assembly PilX family protein n=1 Tax=Suttonella sp. R2A3 TaxID=2908648 RepID=UPI001F3B784D|nr:pilus assembly protein [Suttonella sp. R2A3]UJF25238.1 pilus assembly protein [Suttonella sp. R2A3]